MSTEDLMIKGEPDWHIKHNNLVAKQEQDALKIGDLTGNGITETNLATAIKNNRTQLSEKAKKTDVDDSLALKVDKITGKGLSTNDYDDTEKAEVAKVKNKTDKTYVDTQIASVASGSPKALFATLALLQSDTNANTTDGKKSIYVVAADGKWYYWNGSAWTAGGTYQATEINVLS